MHLLSSISKFTIEQYLSTANSRHRQLSWTCDPMSYQQMQRKQIIYFLVSKMDIDIIFKTRIVNLTLDAIERNYQVNNFHNNSDDPKC